MSHETRQGEGRNPLAPRRTWTIISCTGVVWLGRPASLPLVSGRTSRSANTGARERHARRTGCELGRRRARSLAWKPFTCPHAIWPYTAAPRQNCWHRGARVDAWLSCAGSGELAPEVGIFNHNCFGPWLVSPTRSMTRTWPDGASLSPADPRYTLVPAGSHSMLLGSRPACASRPPRDHGKGQGLSRSRR